MTTRFYELYDDIYIPGRWELRNPVEEAGREVDPWQFTAGRPLRIDNDLRLPLAHPGRPLDFSHAGFSIPVIHPRLSPLFTELARDDLQLLPVRIESQEEPFFILNVTRVVKCIDEEASDSVKHWKPEHGRPERVGEYRSVSGMRIDSTSVGAARVFRPWGWVVALIVSAEIREALERTGATGVKFKEV
jgi:hypothetical protein